MLTTGRGGSGEDRGTVSYRKSCCGERERATDEKEITTMATKTKKPTNKLYVGIMRNSKREVFRCIGTPTQTTFSKIYNAVIGPFRTRAGAEFMAKYGRNNPHCQTVADAERLAKRR